MPRWVQCGKVKLLMTPGGEALSVAGVVLLSALQVNYFRVSGRRPERFLKGCNTIRVLGDGWKDIICLKF